MGGTIDKETGACLDESYHEQYMVLSGAILATYFVIGFINTVIWIFYFCAFASAAVSLYSVQKIDLRNALQPRFLSDFPNQFSIASALFLTCITALSFLEETSLQR
jgi:4-hydroxybenzoate polyprenyltransferase